MPIILTTFYCSYKNQDAFRKKGQGYYVEFCDACME